MSTEINFLLAGVGGQGTLLASTILAEVGLRAGKDVKKSEVHGMAQRGGSVTSYVRWGKKIYAPIVGAGEVDVFVAFEKLEAVRYIECLRPGGLAIVSDHAIPPVSVSSGNDEYPDDERIRRILHQVTDRVAFVPAVKIAGELGNVRAHNVVLLGVLSTFLDVDENIWLEVIREQVPPKHVELNIRAFQQGLLYFKAATMAFTS